MKNIQLAAVLCDSNSNNHVLQQWYAEEHLWMHKMTNLELDELQQQKTNE